MGTENRSVFVRGWDGLELTRKRLRELSGMGNCCTLARVEVTRPYAFVKTHETVN